MSSKAPVILSVVSSSCVLLITVGIVIYFLVFKEKEFSEETPVDVPEEAPVVAQLEAPVTSLVASPVTSPVAKPVERVKRTSRISRRPRLSSPVSSIRHIGVAIKDVVCIANEEWGKQVAEPLQKISRKCPSGETITATCGADGKYYDVGKCSSADDDVKEFCNTKCTKSADKSMGIICMSKCSKEKCPDCDYNGPWSSFFGTVG